jgi:PAS domain S-box-containing protein
MVLTSWILGILGERSAADEGRRDGADEGNALFRYALSYFFAVVIAAWRLYARLRWTIRKTWITGSLPWEHRWSSRRPPDEKSFIVEFDLEGRLTHVSPSAAGGVDRRPAVVPGEFFHSFLPDREVPRAIQAFITVMMGERIRDMRLEMLTRDGFSIPVSAHFLPLFRDREVVGVRGLFRDLRREGKPEMAYDALAKSSLAGVYITQNGRLKLVNPHFQRCTGYTEEDLINADPLSLVHPDDREMVNRRAVMMLKGERTEPYEFRLLTRDGRIERVREIVTSVWYRGQRAVLGNYISAETRPREPDEHSGLSPV